MRGKGSQEQAKSQKQSPLLVIPKESQANNHNIYAKDLGQSHAGSLFVTLVSVSPYRPCLVDWWALFWWCP